MTDQEIRKNLYSRWANMIRRCYDPKAVGYHRYGGRGIRVCRQWRRSFNAFYRWALSNGFEFHLQIDRRNNDGNYEPENCRWVTRKVNAGNRCNTGRGSFRTTISIRRRQLKHGKQMARQMGLSFSGFLQFLILRDFERAKAA